MQGFQANNLFLGGHWRIRCPTACGFLTWPLGRLSAECSWSTLFCRLRTRELCFFYHHSFPCFRDHSGIYQHQRSCQTVPNIHRDNALFWAHDLKRIIPWIRLFSAIILPSKNTRNEQNQDEAPVRSLSNDFIHQNPMYRNRCVHFIPTVNDTISARNKVCPRKPVKTRAKKRPVFMGCLCWTACTLRQISSFGNSCSLWDFLWRSPKSFICTEILERLTA